MSTCTLYANHSGACTVREPGSTTPCGKDFMSIRDELRRLFGPEADAQVVDEGGLLDCASFREARLASSSGSGLLQTLCGGECLISFGSPWGENIRGCAYLVRDDEAGKVWDAEQRQAREENRHTPTRPKPFPSLRLVVAG